MSKINSIDFYNNFSGHLIEHLTKIIDGKSFIDRLRSYNGQNKERSVIFLAGDSSLDNKYWPLNDPNEQKLCNKPPINGYEDVLEGNNCIPDVAYQINQALIDNRLNDEYVCINTSIEATTLYQRFTGTNYSGDIMLLPQDKFIYDNIKPDDILIVSIGGNDIALDPLPDVKLNFNSFISKSIRDQKSLSQMPQYISYFKNIFKDKVEQYIEKLCSKNLTPNKGLLPSLIIPCMVYFPSLTQNGFADDEILDPIGYKTGNHKILEDFIKDLYCDSTRYISLMKTKKGFGNPHNIVDPCPLYEVLDSSNDKLYLRSVEPSIEGGKLMAARFVDQIKIHVNIRSHFSNVGSDDFGHTYSMQYFRNEFLHYYNVVYTNDKYEILVTELLLESNKLNHFKKDKYYYNELKRYINIIFKDLINIDDIQLFIMNQVPISEAERLLAAHAADFSWGDTIDDDD